MFRCDGRIFVLSRTVKPQRPWILAVLGAAILADLALATCPGYEATIAGVTMAGTDPNSACAAHNSTSGVGGTTSPLFTYTYTAGTVSGSGSSETWPCMMTTSFTWAYGSGTSGPDATGAGDRLNVVTCPTTACSGNNGKTYSSLATSSYSSGESLCGVDGCSYTAASSGTARKVIATIGGVQAYMQDMTGNGTSCLPSSGSPSPGQQIDNGVPSATCASGSGNISCQTQTATGKNCGTYNGDQVCVADIPPGTCVAYSSGGVACTTSSGSTSATSPPSPDNGTAGVPATPSEIVSNPAGTTNYYNSSTVAGSTKPTGTTGTGPTGSTTGTGAGTSSGSGDCASTNSCTSGTVPTYPDVPTIESSTNAYLTALRSTPIVAALSGISAAIPAGTCPAPTITLFGHSFTLDAQCTLFDTLATALGAIFMVVYTIVGIKILMSA